MTEIYLFIMRVIKSVLFSERESRFKTFLHSALADFGGANLHFPSLDIMVSLWGEIGHI